MRKGPRDPLKTPLPIGEILSQVLKSPRMKQTISLSHLQHQWPEIVGPALYRKSLPLKIFGKRLIIGVAGSVWANELEFLKLDLLEKVRKELPTLPIEEIRFQISHRD